MSIHIVSLTPDPVYEAAAYGQPPKMFTVTNQDLQFPLYFSSEPGTLDIQSSQITPGKSESFDGTKDVWVSTLDPNAVIRVDVKFGSVASQSPALGPVTKIFGGGFIWNGSSFVGSAAFVIPATSFVIPVLLADVSSYASYDLTLQAGVANQGTVGAALGPQIQIAWYDDLVSGIPVFEEDWWPWGNSVLGVSGLIPNAVTGCGPMHGRYMSIAITNNGNTQMNINWLNVFGSNRSVPYSDWRQNLSGMTIAANGLTNLIGAFVPPSITGFDNCLGTSGAPGSTLTNNIYFLPLGLYAGPVNFDVEIGSAGMQGTTSICHITQMLSGQLQHARQGWSVLWNDKQSLQTANTGVQGNAFFPRAGCALVIQGPATGSSELTWNFTAQQAA